MNSRSTDIDQGFKKPCMHIKLSRVSVRVCMLCVIRTNWCVSIFLTTYTLKYPFKMIAKLQTILVVRLEDGFACSTLKNYC